MVEKKQIVESTPRRAGRAYNNAPESESVSEKKRDRMSAKKAPVEDNEGIFDRQDYIDFLGFDPFDDAEEGEFTLVESADAFTKTGPCKALRKVRRPVRTRKSNS
jgi:hypothetical protein